MIYTDCFLRESLRHHKFNGFGLGLHREVVAPQGISLPSAPDIVIPRGTWITVASDAIHHDPETYAAPDDFLPWRWMGSPENNRADICTGDGEEAQHGIPYGVPKPVEMHETSETFLAFGRGKEACPGRFFAADYARLVIAHIAMNYKVHSEGGIVKQGQPSFLYLLFR
ncbi:cytochrome P450 [Colletotrichum falcatum]|nr:cytochrome P450 [Colletotrichum falcatum]